MKINLSKHNLATLRILNSYLPRDILIKKSIKKPLQIVSYKTFETVRKHFVLLVVYWIVWFSFIYKSHQFSCHLLATVLVCHLVKSYSFVFPCSVCLLFIQLRYISKLKQIVRKFLLDICPLKLREKLKSLSFLKIWLISHEISVFFFVTQFVCDIRDKANHVTM